MKIKININNPIPHARGNTLNELSNALSRYTKYRVEATNCCIVFFDRKNEYVLPLPEKISKYMLELDRGNFSPIQFDLNVPPYLLNI